MSIFVTGDTHGEHEVRRLIPENYPWLADLNRSDYVIIAGDFGAVWGKASDQYWLDWLDSKNFTTLFVDGNHENFDLLSKYPVEEWDGGKVQYVRPHVIHLMRGQVYNIDGCKIFTMGGAQSHDIEGGILDPDDPDLYNKAQDLNKRGLNFRIDLVNWWKQELPSQEEYQEGLDNLARVDNTVDYVITHEAPTKIVESLGLQPYELTNYLQGVCDTVNFKKWLFGHYHVDNDFGSDLMCVYEGMYKIRG
jgi:predicted phosphodiesterase